MANLMPRNGALSTRQVISYSSVSFKVQTAGCGGKQPTKVLEPTLPCSTEMSSRFNHCLLHFLGWFYLLSPGFSLYHIASICSCWVWLAVLQHRSHHPLSLLLITRGISSFSTISYHMSPFFLVLGQWQLQQPVMASIEQQVSQEVFYVQSCLVGSKR